MFNFAAVLSGTVAIIGDAMGLIDPTSLFGGVVTVAIVGAVMVSLVKRVRRLAR